MQTISDQEIKVVRKSASNAFVYPLTWLEQQVLECIDPNSGVVNTVEGANRLMQLMKSTNTVCILIVSSSIDWGALFAHRVYPKYIQSLCT